MTPRAKVVVVLLALLAGCVLVGVVSHEARADTGAGSAVGDYGWLTIAGIALTIVFYRWIVGGWRRANALIEWARALPRPGETADAEALQAALDEVGKRNGPANGAVEPADQPPAGMPNGNTYCAVEDFDANIDRDIAERLQRKAKYDTYAAEMYSAHRELDDDQLIENVIDLWGRTYKP